MFGTTSTLRTLFRRRFRGSSTQHLADFAVGTAVFSYRFMVVWLTVSDWDSSRPNCDRYFNDFSNGPRCRTML